MKNSEKAKKIAEVQSRLDGCRFQDYCPAYSHKAHGEEDVHSNVYFRFGSLVFQSCNNHLNHYRSILLLPHSRGDYEEF